MTGMRTSSKKTRLAAPVAAVAILLGTTALSVVPAEAKKNTAPGHCAKLWKVDVPGAEMQKSACLDDLTTAGTVASGHTNQADWNGLHAAGTTNPSGVPGIQVDGYFPDDSTSNTNNGWNHDSQFVIRLPDDWNGGLVVSGAPGVRAQYANDFIIGDWVLSKGFAFASTDKGNVGAAFYDDGSEPGGSIREWHRRVTQLTRATKRVVQAALRQPPPARTYMAGISNGGYLTRWQLENNPGLYDGGLDWEGTLFRAEGPNLLTYLPTALEALPGVRRHRRPGRARRDDRRRLRAGLGVPVAVPLHLLLGPHPADLPRGVRPAVGRRPRRRHPLLRKRNAALRRRLRLRVAPAVGEGTRCGRWS